ncbi:MAG: hypothetical protein ACKOWK_07295 [Micrococcales bacterium]
MACVTAVACVTGMVGVTPVSIVGLVAFMAGVGLVTFHHCLEVIVRCTRVVMGQSVIAAIVVVLSSAF